MRRILALTMLLILIIVPLAAQERPDSTAPTGNSYIPPEFDSNGNPWVNDPAVNPDANACYEGGSRAGKCYSDSDWACGWYYIRWEGSLTTDGSNEKFEDLCPDMLPPEITPNPQPAAPPPIAVPL